MRMPKTIDESRVSARLTVGHKCWAPSRLDRVEQEIACLAAESDRFDWMSDEQWCNFLEGQSHA